MAFLKKTPGIVGMEIDTGAIRAVELQVVKEKHVLSVAAEEPLDEGAVSEGVITDVPAVKEALGRLWAKAGFRSRKVVIGVFGQGVIIRLIHFPKVPEEKLSQALRLQADEYFPIPLSQLVLDHAVVGETVGEDGPMLEVLLVAAKRVQLDTYVWALESNNLVPVIVEPSPLALARVLPAQRKKTDNIAVVDLSNGLSSLVVFSGGSPRFVRAIPVSLLQYVREKNIPFSLVNEQTNGNQVAALSEVAAVGAGKNMEESPYMNWAEKVVSEVRSSVNYYQQHDQGKDIDLLCLSGRGARVAGLVEMMQEELGIPTELINPLAHVTMDIASGKVSLDLGRVSTDFAVSVGLALRGLEEV